jgi:hypothetical protein
LATFIFPKGSKVQSLVFNGLLYLPHQVTPITLQIMRLGLCRGLAGGLSRMAMMATKQP